MLVMQSSVGCQTKLKLEKVTGGKERSSFLNYMLGCHSRKQWSDNLQSSCHMLLQYFFN